MFPLLAHRPLSIGAGPTPLRAGWIVRSGMNSTAAQAKNVVTEAGRAECADHVAPQRRGSRAGAGLSRCQVGPGCQGGLVVAVAHEEHLAPASHAMSVRDGQALAAELTLAYPATSAILRGGESPGPNSSG